jgi:hypothetical protein
MHRLVLHWLYGWWQHKQQIDTPVPTASSQLSCCSCNGQQQQQQQPSHYYRRGIVVKQARSTNISHVSLLNQSYLPNYQHAMYTEKKFNDIPSTNLICKIRI